MRAGHPPHSYGKSADPHIFEAMRTPDQIYGDLFIAVQTSRIFPDSKTFVDCIPVDAPENIVRVYERERDQQGFDLRAFVLKNFRPPAGKDSGFQGDPTRPVEEHIDALWNVLRREADTPVPGSSLIPLPNRYIVPGGRFGEIYYWDSYFTILGLLESGYVEIAKDMLANFAYLIDRVGHIPNGNRTYFTTRSQPPFFALMVSEVAEYTHDPEIYSAYTPFVRKEYEFWMSRPVEAASFPDALLRCVALAPDILLNRYWDNTDLPRQESYLEDVELAANADREPAGLFRDIRAACESGWDFSARWCRDPHRLDTILTTSILPVDLNCLLWTMESFLSERYHIHDMEDEARAFLEAANRRRQLIDRYFWDDKEGVYRDYNFIDGRQTDVISLATLFPLFIGIASEDKAERVIHHIRKFIKPGGLVTTLYRTGHQWDAPNGWAPLQWIGYQALLNYGYEALAGQIASNWINNVLRVYKNTGKLVEKYNVEDLTLEAGGGEYPVQDGFGWTNGVLKKFLTLYA